MLRISILQDCIFDGDKKANLEKTERQLETLFGTTDLVLLPEMFTTGFMVDKLELAESMSGSTVTNLKTWAVRYQFAIAGSFMVCEEGRFFNRAFFVFPSGEIHTADKRHLFSVAAENEFFSPGSKRLIVDYKGFKILVLICYDLRFPVWSRNVGREYDLLIYLANWPASRRTAWDALLSARAIENQVYLCAVNRIGTDYKGILYSGGSKVLDAKAEPLWCASDNETAIMTLSLSKEDLENFRTKFPVWKDADSFKIL